MKGAHLRRSSWPLHRESIVFMAAMLIFGIGIGLAVEAIHDKRAESILPASTTTVPMILGDPVVATSTTVRLTETAGEIPRLPARNLSLSRAERQEPTVATPTTASERRPTTTTAVPRTPLEVAQAYAGKTGPFTEGGFWCAKAVSYFAEQAKVEGWESSDSPARLHTNAMADGRIVGAPFVGYVVFIDLTGQNFANQSSATSASWSR